MSKNQILADIHESKSDENDNQDFKILIDDLYSQSCKQYTTYETMVHKGFCALVDDHFSEHDTDAYTYARKAYGYMTSYELNEMDKKNEDDGICRHGLDVMTCPCGCFEGD